MFNQKGLEDVGTMDPVETHESLFTEMTSLNK